MIKSSSDGESLEAKQIIQRIMNASNRNPLISGRDLERLDVIALNTEQELLRAEIRLFQSTYAGKIRLCRLRDIPQVSFFPWPYDDRRLRDIDHLPQYHERPKIRIEEYLRGSDRIPYINLDP